MNPIPTLTSFPDGTGIDLVVREAVDAQRKRDAEMVRSAARYHHDIGRLVFAGVLFRMADDMERGTK